MNKRVAVNGCFEILHVGHIRFLKNSAKLGDELIVLVNGDDYIRSHKGREPVFPLEERKEMLKALKCVNSVWEFHGENPGPELRDLKPDIYVSGYTGEKLLAREAVEKGGGVCVFIERTEGMSTTDIIERIKGESNE